MVLSRYTNSEYTVLNAFLALETLALMMEREAPERITASMDASPLRTPYTGSRAVSSLPPAAFCSTAVSRP